MCTQLQLAPSALTHLFEACWPRGRHSEVGLGALPAGVRIQILGCRLQLIRARRGGGKPGIRLCPAARPLRGMVSPSPAPRAPAPTSNRGAACQPCALVQPRDKRLAPRSRRPASAAPRSLQVVLRGDAAPRPPGRRAAAPSSPPPRAAAAAAAAKGRSHAPPSSGESARRAFAGPSDRRSGAPPAPAPTLQRSAMSWAAGERGAGGGWLWLGGRGASSPQVEPGTCRAQSGYGPCLPISLLQA